MNLKEEKTPDTVVSSKDARLRAQLGSKRFRSRCLDTTWAPGSSLKMREADPRILNARSQFDSSTSYFLLSGPHFDKIWTRWLSTLSASRAPVSTLWTSGKERCSNSLDHHPACSLFDKSAEQLHRFYRPDSESLKSSGLSIDQALVLCAPSLDRLEKL